MNKKNYIGIELAKYLKENGCEIESENEIRVCSFCLTPLRTKMICSECDKRDMMNLYISQYSYYDIIVTHAIDFFGVQIPNEVDRNRRELTGTEYILSLLQQNKQSEADEYIKKHCKFNKKKLCHHK